MAGLESQLLATVTRHLKLVARDDPALVFRKRHGSPMGITGDPDLYGLWHGIHFEIELKRLGESPTLLQTLRLQKWAAAGARTFVVHSLPELKAALDTLRPVV